MTIFFSIKSIGESMETHYTYSGYSHALQRLVGIIFLLFAPPISTLMIVSGAIGIFVGIQKQEALFFLIFGMIGIVGFLVIGIGNLYFFPSITTSTEGVEIPFLFRKIFIPWSNIIGVDTAWFIGRSLRVVKCRKITLFHWLYGLVYGGTEIHPSFLISSRIDGFDDLMRKIKSHTEQNNTSTS